MELLEQTEIFPDNAGLAAMQLLRKLLGHTDKKLSSLCMLDFADTCTIGITLLSVHPKLYEFFGNIILQYI